MTTSSTRRLASALLAPCLLAAGGAVAAAETPVEPPPCPQAFAEARLDQGVRLCAQAIRQAGPGEVEATGDVTIHAKGARIQADRIRLREERYLDAEGNVLVVWGANRVLGDRMTYDLEEETGTIENASGEVEPEFYFWADEVEKIGEDRVRLRRATVTTCTQPIPYWSFSVSSAKIRLEKYAHLRNLRLRAGRVPIFYLPYLVWPVKPERAAGFLLPNFGTTRTRGNVVSFPFFLPLGDSADATLFTEYYTRAGWGAGAEVRAIPNREGEAHLSAYYIWDQVSDAGRFNWKYQQTQKFLNGFRMVADVEQVSDFDYFTDFERDLARASQPQIRGRLELSRNGAWTSLNVREFRIEQLFSDGTSLVQQTLPEIEWRGRSRHVGRTPLYFAFESSVSHIRQQSSRIDAHYARGDFFPTLSAPFSPRPWLDVTPTVELRSTYYSQSREISPAPDGSTIVLDDDLVRVLWGGGIEIVGPKLFKIYNRPESGFSTRYKHTIEPRIVYGYQRADDTADEILIYDEVDRLFTSSNRIQYGIRSRLFAQRPRARPPDPEGEGERVLLPPSPGGPSGVQPSPTPGRGGQAPDPDAATEPVEIASFELRQSRAFDRDLSFADLDGDGIVETTSASSDVDATGRFHPAPWMSLDLRARYNHLYDRVSDLSLSGSVHRENVGRLSFSLVRRPGLVPGTRDSTQLRYGAGVSLWDGRVRVATDGTWVPTAQGLEAKIPDQRWVVEFYTQCCGFLTEYLARDFAGNERRDFRFTIDLRGIGKLLDFHGGTE